MKAESLKSKLNKMNATFSLDDSSDIMFSLNGKDYEATVTVSGQIASYCTKHYSKFQGRTFDTLPQVVRHSQQ